MYEISVRASFSSAHNLRSYKGKCERLHGHNWQVEVYLRGENLDEEGMLMDFKKLKMLLKQVLEELDHRYINEIPPFDKLNPTSENIAKYIYDKLSAKVDKEGVKLYRVDVWETESSRASYVKEE